MSVLLDTQNKILLGEGYTFSGINSSRKATVLHVLQSQYPGFKWNTGNFYIFKIFNELPNVGKLEAIVKSTEKTLM